MLNIKSQRYYRINATFNPFKHRHYEEGSLLAAFAICTALSLAIYLSSFFVDPAQIRNLSWNFTLEHQPTPTFGMPAPPPYQLSGIKLGMTPPEAESAQPGMIYFANSGTGMTGKFKLGKGIHHIAFSGPYADRQAHSIAYRETFKNISKNEMRQRLEKKFGIPAEIQCEKLNFLLGKQCRLEWKRQGGVVLEAKIRTVKLPTGELQSELFFVATDPVIKNRFAFPVEKRNEKHPRKADMAFKRRMMAISSAARNF